VTAGGVVAALAAAGWLGFAGSGGGRLRWPGRWPRVAAAALGRLGRPGLGHYLAIGLALPYLAIALATKDSAAVLLATAVPVTAGAGIAARARRLARTRTAAGEALSDTLLAHTARGERARIARELHDVVAHHISMIAVLAETGRLTTPDLPEAGARRFAEIGDTARAGLTEMRRLLGVLRDDALAAGDTDGAAHRDDVVAAGPAETGTVVGPGTALTAGNAERASRQPQPGLWQLTELVDAARDASAAGTRLIISGPVSPLDPGVELAAYRIVQEALTNARRHAPGAAVDVELRYSPGALRLRVRDSGPGPAGAPSGDGAPGAGRATSGGHGLAGMRERAFSAGGSLYAGLAPGGGFLVEAVLPADLAPAGRRDLADDLAGR
jgi:signal transduction histidine kinase